MKDCAEAVGNGEFLTLVNELAACSGELMTVVKKSTPKPDRAIIAPVFANRASWTECDRHDDDTMSCFVVEAAAGERMRIVVNQLYFSQTSYTCKRNLCQRSVQSQATARYGEITFLIDIPRAPSIVREAEAASR